MGGCNVDDDATAEQDDASDDDDESAEGGQAIECPQNEDGECVECTQQERDACGPDSCVENECVDLCADLGGVWEGILRYQSTEPGHSSTAYDTPMRVYLREVEGESQQPYDCLWGGDEDATGEPRAVEGTVDGAMMYGTLTPTEAGVHFCFVTGDGHGALFYDGLFVSRCAAASGVLHGYGSEGGIGLVRSL